MLKFYVSCRPLRIGKELLMPSEQLQRGFAGLDIQFSVMSMNMNVDGRILYEIIVGSDSEYTDEECIQYRDAIVEGLQPFACHLKSLQSAVDLIKKIDDVDYTISGDSLVGCGNKWD